MFILQIWNVIPDLHGGTMYTHRNIEIKLLECLEVFSIVGIMGPRQSGKSTLLLNTLKDYTYVTFDDFTVIELFKNDPEKFFRIHQNKVIFDEVQKVPEIFSYIKRHVDNDRNNTGKFILTGSSNFSYIKDLSDTLAGRIALLTLLPYQYSEVPRKNKSEAIVFGSYPEMVNKKYKLSHIWYSSYIETYINRDVSAIANIGDLSNFRRLISLLAANTGQTLNLSKLGAQIGVDSKTVKRWIHILEVSYIVFSLKPFYNNYGKRITKSPKIYFYDTGIVNFLLGIESLEQLERSNMCGSIFENYVIAEVIKASLHSFKMSDFYFYRSAAGEEVDLIVDNKNKLDLIEIKYGETYRPKMLSGIESIISKNDSGYLLYNGEEKPHLDNIKIIPYSKYLE